MTMTPSGVPSRSRGVANPGPDVGSGLPHGGHAVRELRLGCHPVLDVDRPPVEQCPSTQPVATYGNGVTDRL